MKYRNRYIFIKRTYPKTIILFENNGKYRGYSLDEEFLNFLKFKSLKSLDYFHINYLVVQNMEILEHKVFTPNLYDLYYLRFRILKVLKAIKNKKL